MERVWATMMAGLVGAYIGTMRYECRGVSSGVIAGLVTFGLLCYLIWRESDDR